LAFFRFLYVKKIKYQNFDIEFIIYAKFSVKMASIFKFYQDESSFFEKLMTYSGLVSGYIRSKKAKKKGQFNFFLSKKYFLNFLTVVDRSFFSFNVFF
jgi:hypothetical protein